MRNALLLVVGCTILLSTPLLADAKPHLELITDRSGASEACGPVAIRWGFMCTIGARFEDRVYALNFTRTPDTAWDAQTPIEAPLALWSRHSGKWTSVLLDGPKRTYQTPTLLLSPDGRANVFTVHPFDSTIQWFRADDASNTKFTRSEIDIGWGSYMSGAIDRKGEAALVYWTNGPDYKQSKLGCTLLDTITGKSRNLIVDSPGAPYCYNHVFFDQTGVHILSTRSEVADFNIADSRNHYTDLHYYHCANPNAAEPKWQQVVVVQNERARFQTRANLVDPSGRVHLLYQYVLDDGHGKTAGGLKMVYAASREPISSEHVPEFVSHEIESPGEARLFMTKEGAIYIVTYDTSNTLQYAKVLDPVAGKFSDWKTLETDVTFNRLFPIDARSGSTPSDELAAILIPAINIPEKNNMYYFTIDPAQ